MSRLDPKVAEENRKAYLRDMASRRRKLTVGKWLRDNPEIGILNMGGGSYEYYRMHRTTPGKIVRVQPPAE